MFSILNGGVVIVARSHEVDEQKKLLRLAGASIINGSQTQGVLQDFYGKFALEELSTIHIKYELSFEARGRTRGPTVSAGQSVDRRILLATEPIMPLSKRPAPWVPSTIIEGCCVSASMGITSIGSPSRSVGMACREFVLRISASPESKRVRSNLCWLMCLSPISTSIAACERVKA